MATIKITAWCEEHRKVELHAEFLFSDTELYVRPCPQCLDKASENGAEEARLEERLERLKDK